MNPDIRPVSATLPAPATPALHGDRWWRARTGVLEGQRQAYADELARRDAIIDELNDQLERQNDAIDGMGELIQSLEAELESLRPMAARLVASLPPPDPPSSWDVP